MSMCAVDASMKPGSRHLTVGREAPVVLRPEPMHHERKRPAGTLLVWGPVGSAVLRGLAIRRRPRQRQNIEVELARFTLTTVLSECDDGENKGEAESHGGNMRQPVNAMTAHARPNVDTRTNRKLIRLNGSL